MVFPISLWFSHGSLQVYQSAYDGKRLLEGKQDARTLGSQSAKNAFDRHFGRIGLAAERLSVVSPWRRSFHGRSLTKKLS